MASSPSIEIIARGVLLHGSRILLCRNVKRGYHYLPGGHVEFNEPAAAALARELIEEADFAIRPGALLMVLEAAFNDHKRRHHEVNLVFHVEQAENGGLGAVATEQPRRPGTEPPAVVSREPDIAFDWVELAALHETDLRPLEIKAWLMSRGAGDDPAPPGSVEWLSSMEG